MKGKQVPDFNSAYMALTVKGYDFVLVPAPADGFFEDGFQVIIKDGPFADGVKRLPGYTRTAPEELMTIYVGGSRAPQSYHVEKPEDQVLADLRSTGQPIEFEN